ncbi:conserved protein of unknown function [Rhodovastum atsumiense]|nr:conserved protein of unknown function [Rhodovastum atsumiense]
MPFDAVGFSSEAKVQNPPAPSSRLRALWQAFQRGVRRASDRGDLVASIAMLEEARTLIEDEDRWIQGRYLKNGRRCAMGALQEAGRHYRRGVRRDAVTELLKVARIRGHHSIESMNDNISHREVVVAFDTAIAGIVARRA